MYRSPMPSRRGTSGGLRERKRQITSAVAVVAAAAVVVVVVVNDGVGINGCVTSALHPRRWSTSCQARGGNVTTAAAVRSSHGDSGGVGATPMSRVTTHGCQTNNPSGNETTLSCIV